MAALAGLMMKPIEMGFEEYHDWSKLMPVKTMLEVLSQVDASVWLDMYNSSDDGRRILRDGMIMFTVLDILQHDKAWHNLFGNYTMHFDKNMECHEFVQLNQKKYNLSIDQADAQHLMKHPNACYQIYIKNMTGKTEMFNILKEGGTFEQLRT